MGKILSQAISVLLHPLFAPVYGLLIIFNSGTYLAYLPYEAKRVIFLIVLLNTVVIPIGLFPVLYYRKYIHSISIGEKRERVLPMLLTAALYYIAFYLLDRLQVSGLIRSYIQVGALLVLVTALVSWFWKISLHMIGLGGLTGLLIAMILKFSAALTVWLVILILLTGLLGTARLYLNEHRPPEIYAGYLLGFAWMLGALLI